MVFHRAVWAAKHILSDGKGIILPGMPQNLSQVKLPYPQVCFQARSLQWHIKTTTIRRGMISAAQQYISGSPANCLYARVHRMKRIRIRTLHSKLQVTME